jgi:hypothetical protein
VQANVLKLLRSTTPLCASVVADPQARYFGAALDTRGLTPDGANPRIGPTRLDEWLRRSVPQG